MGANEGASVDSSVGLSDEEHESPPHVKPECCIFKVHHHLWEIRETAYKPQIVAIGPYHHKKENSSSSSSEEEEKRKVNYSMMEKHKRWYLCKILRNKREDVRHFKQAIQQKVGRVRNSYAEPLSFSNDELVEMMVLDGCFIIELLRRNDDKRLQDRDDPVFNMAWMMNSLQRDLMLFENQLPLFVLRELFGMIEPPDDEKFVQLVLDFFRSILPDPKRRWDSRECPDLSQVSHLLELIHLKWCSQITSNQNDMIDGHGGESNHVINLIPKSSDQNKITSDQNKRERTDDTGEGRLMHCAKILGDAGVKFEEIEGETLFDIRFTEGTLQIPTLIIEERTEAFLRNLVAYEQYYWDRQNCAQRPRFVTDYVCFLDCLIGSSKDVEILCRRGIIHNLLGDDEAVSDIFNKITDSVIVARNNSRYYGIEKKVDSYCQRRWNRIMAILRKTYLDSPAALSNWFVTFVTLYLSAVQTMVAVLTYDK